VAVIEVTTIRHHKMSVVRVEETRLVMFECSCGWLGAASQARWHLRQYRTMLNNGTSVRFWML
jgi:hypothetical protein